MTDYAELPDPVNCTTCHQPFRPGGSWRQRHGHTCADCLDATPPPAKRKPRLIVASQHRDDEAGDGRDRHT